MGKAIQIVEQEVFYSVLYINLVHYLLRVTKINKY